MAANKLKEKEIVNVLIVDDHKMLRDGLKVMLASLKKWIHFKVMEAESGEEALLKITRNPFQLIILDYNMPGISGSETVYRILRFKPKMKILALSNYDELPYIQNMIDAGAKGYVLKNIEPSEMLHAIKTIFSDKRYYCNEVAIKLLEAEEEKTIEKIRSKKILTRRATWLSETKEIKNPYLGKKMPTCGEVKEEMKQ